MTNWLKGLLSRQIYLVGSLGIIDKLIVKIEHIAYSLEDLNKPRLKGFNSRSEHGALLDN